MRCAYGLLATLVLAAPWLAAQNTSGLQPFSLDHVRAAAAASPADVSFLLDAPAGRHGFIGIKGGHLSTAEGQRFRCWGVNLTDWSPGSRQIPSKEDAPYWAATLARFGVNCVRLQFLDLQAPRGLIEAGSSTRALDSAQLDREDFFLAELKKRGIYIDLNLLVGRPFTEADGVHDAALLKEGAKGTSLFDAKLIELEREYAQQLLTHVNPYTGLSWAKDPALLFVEINNENALYIGYKAPSPFYAAELVTIYNTWLSKRQPPALLAKIRAEAHVAGDAPVPLLTEQKAIDGQRERFLAESQFQLELQYDYFAGMRAYLREKLGVQSLVIGTADFHHAGSGYPGVLANNAMDVIDGHDYWDPPEAHTPKVPMVNDPLHSIVVELARSPLAGKPYTVSEVNEPFPNDYGSEALPMVAAYGALQDWDGIFWYTFEPKADAKAPAKIGDAFDLSFDPVKMPELAAGAVMFLEGEVSAGRSLVTRGYTLPQVFDSINAPWETRPFFTPGFSAAVALEHEVRVAANSSGPGAVPNASPYSADTGQLNWYTFPAAEGEVTIDTPRSQALVGFVHGHRELSNMMADVRTRFCTLWLDALDGQPIRSSSRMLFVAGGRSANTGEAWNLQGSGLKDSGAAPTLTEVIHGTLELRGLDPAQAVTLQALDGAGQPLGAPAAGKRAGSAWSLPLGAEVTTWYSITVKR